MENMDDIVNAYLLIKKEGKSVYAFLVRHFGTNSVENYFYSSYPREDPPHTIAVMLNTAIHKILTCDIKELPLYVNHPSSDINSLVEKRLQGG